MRTFKRPMFRKGGNVGNGIMSGITDRVQAQEGFAAGYQGMGGDNILNFDETEITETNTPETNTLRSPGINVDIGKPKTTAEYIEELKAGAGEYGGMDPLTSFLLTAGPSVAGATGFADAIQRLQPGTERLLKDAEAKAKYDRDIRMAGTKLALADQQKFDDRRFNLALKADDRLYNKDLIKDEREYNLKLLEDQRAYNKLEKEDQRKYDAKILEEARKYQDMKDEEKRVYERKLIEEGRQFELEQIIRKEEFQLKMLDKELDANDPFNQKNLAKVYFEEYKSKAPANNRATYEAENIKAEMIEKVGANNVDQDPLVGGGIHGSLEKKKKNKNVGKVYYDVDTGEVKQLRKTKDGELKFDIIDLETYVKPEAPEVTTKDEDISQRFEYLSDEQRKFFEDLKQKTDETPSA